MQLRPLISLGLIACASVASADVYKIDATATSKTIRTMDYRMGTPTAPASPALSANNYYLMRDGEPWLPVMGEIHYTRYPAELWEDAILKIKAGGIDTIATYCFWIHHEEIPGEFDFTGRRNLRQFIELCARHDMKVWLRIGPWCHGEARNGGFPDWLMEADFEKRRSNPRYLARVESLWQQYYDQAEGLLYKDGGPIVGIQLENEFGGPPEHILDLKRLAREIGFDVPFYTVTGWNNVRIPDLEVLPVQAGYPDNFWDRGTDRTELNEQYLFMAGVPINTGVGTDVLPVVEVYGRRTYNPSDYPWLTAELGLGIQWTERRRPVIDSTDAAALVIVKLAGGANCIGYYMYHGGSQPQGKRTPLHETGYNETPQVSYDFQAAVGEFGEVHPKYHHLKLIHYWLHDFGTDLAPMIPSMPERRPSGVRDVQTFRTMLRADEDSGYLFFNNYQRFVENQPLADIQVEVELQEESITIPRRPITIPSDSYGFWPVNLALNGSRLKYATAQPFARFNGESSDSLFFFAQDGIAPEFVVDAATVGGLDASSGVSLQRNDEEHIISIDRPGLDTFITIRPEDGKPIHLRVLSLEQALHSFIMNEGERRDLVVTDGAYVLKAHQGVELRSLGRNQGNVWFFDANAPATDAFISREWNVPEKKIDVDLSRIAEDADRAEYRLSIPADALDGENLYDVYLDVDQVSNYLTVRSGDELIGDWYYIGPHYRPSLRHWSDQAVGQTLTLRLDPITRSTQVYLEDRYRPDFTTSDSQARIENVTPVPLYNLHLPHPEGQRVNGSPHGSGE